MKKILGVPLVMVVIGLVVVGGAMAALVSYLSNPVTADATVDSPLELQIRKASGQQWGNSLDLGTVYGGGEALFRIREINRANTDITADLVIMVNESGVVNKCEELDIVFRGVGSTTWHNISCVEAGNNLEFKITDTLIPAGHDQEYEVNATFNKYAKGTYVATVQHR